jgi:uncharacterized membrane protein YfcA
MTPLEFTIAALGLAMVAGTLGALLGIGGGVLLVPALTLGLGVDIRYAIGASIVSVIATSSGAGAAYLRARLVSLRLAMFLEVATTTGALVGAFLAGRIPAPWLHQLFAGLLLVTAAAMARTREGHSVASRPDRLAARLRIQEPAISTPGAETIAIGRTPIGFVASGAAGVVSGLLGIGGGVLKVPVMHLVMGVPMKVAVATSTFMIGVTAAASAGVYFARGDLDPFVAGPVALGVLVGTRLGAFWMGRIGTRGLRWVFVGLLVAIAFEMARGGVP